MAGLGSFAECEIASIKYFSVTLMWLTTITILIDSSSFKNTRDLNVRSAHWVFIGLLCFFFFMFWKLQRVSKEIDTFGIKKWYLRTHHSGRSTLKVWKLKMLLVYIQVWLYYSPGPLKSMFDCQPPSNQGHLLLTCVPMVYKNIQPSCWSSKYVCLGCRNQDILNGYT